MGTFADYERKVIRERTVKGRRRRAEEGVQPCRNMSPFGYHVVSERDVLAGLYPAGTVGTYQIVEAEARWVREIFGWYAAGLSLRQVAQRLQDHGLPTPRGGVCWRPKTIKWILENPVHKGMATFGKFERQVDESRLERGYKRMDFNRATPEERWVHIKAPALVDEHTWDLCQERLRGNRNLLSGNPERRYLLTGLLRCPKCGRRMRGIRTGRGGYTYYRCVYNNASACSAGLVCSPKHFRADEVEACVVEALRLVASGPESVASAYAVYDEQRRSAPNAAAQERQSLQAELTALASREQAVIEAQIAGVQSGADPAAYKAVFGQIRDRRAALQKRLAELASLAPPIPEANVQTEAAELAGRLAAIVEELLASADLTNAEKHGLLTRIIEAVVPGEEKVRIELKPSSRQTVTHVCMWVTVAPPRIVRVEVKHRAGAARVP